MTASPNCVALVPAAGHSQRMGREKLLLPWGETVMVGAVIDALRRGGAGEVVLVVSPDNLRVRRWADRASVGVVANPAPERGMLSSIWVGLEALGGGAALASEGRTLLVCPGDHPALRPATVVAVLRALEAGADLAVPVVEGRRGHPLGIAPRAVPAIADLDLAVGLRELLERYEVREVSVSDPGAILDLDRPEEYRRAVERLR